MSKKISAANAVGNAVEQAAALFDVACYRMNSRTFTVVGAGGRERPMFFGQWRDRNGIEHKGGMADYLLMPRITMAVLNGAPPGFVPMNRPAGSIPEKIRVVVPLWIECKSGKGDLEPSQRDFRDDVIARGAYHITCHDSADNLMAWFELMGVQRG